MQQLFGGWLGEGTDAADVPKVEAGGRAHSGDMSTHANAGGWDDGY